MLLKARSGPGKCWEGLGKRELKSGIDDEQETQGSNKKLSGFLHDGLLINVKNNMNSGIYLPRINCSADNDPAGKGRAQPRCSVFAGFTGLPRLLTLQTIWHLYCSLHFIRTHAPVSHKWKSVSNRWGGVKAWTAVNIGRYLAVRAC